MLHPSHTREGKLERLVTTSIYAPWIIPKENPELWPTFRVLPARNNKSPNNCFFKNV